MRVFIAAFLFVVVFPVGAIAIILLRWAYTVIERWLKR